MLLKDLIELKNSIDSCRIERYELVRNKGKYDPNVLELSQQLDKNVFKMQKMIDEINSSKNQLNSIA